MPTGSLTYNTIIGSLDGGLYFIPSGSTTVGVSQSAAVAQVVSISPAANTSNIHTNYNATASYYIISSSNQEYISTEPSKYVIYFASSSVSSSGFIGNPSSSVQPSGSGPSGWIQVNIKDGDSVATIITASINAINSSSFNAFSAT